MNVPKLIHADNAEELKLWADKIAKLLQDNLVESGTSGGGGLTVASIQHGQTVLSASSTTATVTSVDPDNSVLLFTFSTSADNVGTTPRGVITDETTLTFTRGQNTGTTTIEWTLIEYE